MGCENTVKKIMSQITSYVRDYQVQEGGNKTGAMRMMRKLQIPKPMSMREMNMVADRQIFLLRNMEKVKRIRQLLMKKGSDTNNNKSAKEDQPKRRDKVKGETDTFSLF